MNQTDPVTTNVSCGADLRSWMIPNMLVANDSKMEFLKLGSKQQLKRVDIPFIRVGEDQVTTVMSVRNLDESFGPTLKMDMLITKACKNAYHHLQNIRIIRRFVNQEVIGTIVHTSFTS